MSKIIHTEYYCMCMMSLQQLVFERAMERFDIHAANQACAKAEYWKREMERVQTELPLEHVAEYDAAAEWCARRGLKGNVGDRLPANMSTDGALKYISADPEAFQSRVREMAYALAMEGRI